MVCSRGSLHLSRHSLWHHHSRPSAPFVTHLRPQLVPQSRIARFALQSFQCLPVSCKAIAISCCNTFLTSVTAFLTICKRNQTECRQENDNKTHFMFEIFRRDGIDEHWSPC